MTDKPKTIQEALAEVQKNLSEVDLGGSGAGDFSARERTVFKQRKGFSIEKPTAANTASTISPTPTSSGSTATLATPPISAARGDRVIERRPVRPDDIPTEAPEPAKTEPTKPEPAKMSFDDAYAKARQMAKSAGKDPNTAQFKFDRGGGEKVYQSAATKSDYVPMDKQFKVDIDAPSTTKNPAGPNATVDAPLPPKKPAKIGENQLTNPLIAAFLQLQEKNPSNMFEAAKKAKKDHDGDGKIESGKDEYFGSRFAAAKKAGKLKESEDSGPEETSHPLPSRKPDHVVPVHGKEYGPEAEVHVWHNAGPGGKHTIAHTRKQAHSGSEHYIYKNNPKVSPSTVKKHWLGESANVDEELKGSQHKIDANKNKKIDAEDFKLLRSKKKVKEDAEESKLPKDWGEGIEFSEEELAFFASVEETFTPTEPSRVNKDKAGHTDLTDEVTEAKKKEEPSTERDARQHIQVVAGQAAAGREIDFPHNNGKSTKINPQMGRKITAHLNSLKPAERQAKVKAMHDSPEGMKM